MDNHESYEASTSRTLPSSSNTASAEEVPEDLNVGGVSLGGIAAWDAEAHAAHLPEALLGLGKVERAQWMLAQREKEKAEAETRKRQRQETCAATVERAKRKTDDHFTGKQMVEPELKAGLSGLVSKRKFSGEEEAARIEAEEKAAKKVGARSARGPVPPSSPHANCCCCHRFFPSREMLLLPPLCSPQAKKKEKQKQKMQKKLLSFGDDEEGA